MTEFKKSGIVKFYSKGKAFGFIWPVEDMNKPENERTEHFFHSSGRVALSDKSLPDFNPGDEVTYELAESPHKDGTNAVSVTLTRAIPREPRKSNPNVPRTTIGILKGDVAVLAPFLEVLHGSMDQEMMEALKVSDVEKKALGNLVEILNNQLIFVRSDPPASKPVEVATTTKGKKKSGQSEAQA